ncbi:M48 family metallopeptidase (plasmid) [Paroceanicella profunda]|uniref:M48 family metallopeptidase n=1 Tax=Paroceanicella profunda TaxID=2579971 RepID=A0A5B8FJ61_9RHOB|nr:M48 family metallopeptidase [Paroceanicella profunda]QDL94551.1 M48 family metallopeptidase [Paroceanicella profunda]
MPLRHTPRAAMRNGVLGLLGLATLGACDASNVNAVNAAMTGAAVLAQGDATVSEQRELGQAATKETLQDYTRSPDRKLEGKLTRIVEGIAQANGLDTFPWQVVLLKSGEVNAFTPGGGYIFVEDGIIAQARTEAMMAMVLAHEMAHVQKAHPADGMRDRTAIVAGSSALSAYLGGQGSGLTSAAVDQAMQYVTLAAVNGYGRDKETEADDIGFGYYVKAGYMPSAAPRIFQRFAKLNGTQPALTHFFHGSHPQSADRAKRIQQLVNQLPAGRRNSGINQTDEWQRLTGAYR